MQTKEVKTMEIQILILELQKALSKGGTTIELNGTLFCPQTGIGVILSNQPQH